METVLRAKERATGKSVELSSESFADQNEQLHAIFNSGSALYSEVGIYYLEPKQVVQIKEPPSEVQEAAVEAPKTFRRNRHQHP